MPNHAIPAGAVELKFVRSRGPGGQNVNKVATAVQMRVNVARLDLPLSVQKRLLRLGGSRTTHDGDLIIFVDTTRSQARNRELALARLDALITKAKQVPKRRIATKPSRAAKEKRLATKKHQAATKKNRRRPSPSD